MRGMHSIGNRTRLAGMLPPVSARTMPLPVALMPHHGGGVHERSQ